MFLRKIKELSSKTAFRLTTWYSAIFITGAGIIFIIALYTLSNAIKAQDREQIALKLKEYISIASDEGIDELMEEMVREKAYYQRAGYFVRLSDRQGTTLFCTVPPRFKYMECSNVPLKLTGESSGFIVVKRYEDQDVIEILSESLPSGFTIQVGKASTMRKELVEKFYQVFLIAMALIVATGVASGAFLSVKALAPLRDLIRTVQSITAGDMNARVPVRHHEDQDELDILARLFNKMLKRIQQLVKGMKESLDYVAHDLRTPVARLKAICETTLQKNSDRTELENALMDCAEEADRISEILTTLMEISEAEAGVMRLDRKRQRLKPVIMDAVELYEYVAEEKNFTININIPEDIMAEIDKNRFRQAVANIIDNALKYSHRGGNLDIRAFKRKTGIILSFSDNGFGIAKDDLPRIFDRLYRGNRSRSQKGMGLGLSLVNAVITSHGFSIKAESSQGKGTNISIFLPLK